MSHLGSTTVCREDITTPGLHYNPNHSTNKLQSHSCVHNESTQDQIYTEREKGKCIISDLWHWIPTALCTVCHLVLPVRLLSKPVTPHPRSLILCVWCASRSSLGHCSLINPRLIQTHGAASVGRVMTCVLSNFVILVVNVAQCDGKFTEKFLKAACATQWD